MKNFQRTNSKTFCLHPFTGLSTRENGSINICCRSKPIGWIQNESLRSAWNNEKIKSVRQKVLNGERPQECVGCFRAEDQGIESLRLRNIKSDIPDARVNLYPNALDNLNEDFTLPYEFPSIEIKINNLCNLKCRMCNPLDSTSWNDWEDIKEYYSSDETSLVESIEKLKLHDKPYLGVFEKSTDFWQNLREISPFLKRVEFAGGEPLLDPKHYEILDLLIPYSKNIQIKYATNLTTLGINNKKTIFNYWPYFDSIIVNASIDGIHDVYNYIRGDNKFELVEKNIEKIKKIENVKRVTGAFTVQANNVLQIDNVIKYFLDELGIVFYSHRVNHPRVLSAQVIPNALKRKVITNLEELKYRVNDLDLVKKNNLLEQITIQQIQDNINFLKAEDLSAYWKDCIEYNRTLDKTRNQGPFEEIIPQFKPYLNV